MEPDQLTWGGGGVIAIIAAHNVAMDTADPADNIDAAAARFVPTIPEGFPAVERPSDQGETPDAERQRAIPCRSAETTCLDSPTSRPAASLRACKHHSAP